MPRETVQIPFYSAPPGEAVSQLMSYIAYPNPLDQMHRERFAIALHRTAILYRAESDKVWGASVQKIKPTIFLDDEKTFLASMKRGMKKLSRHMFTTYTFLMPHEIALNTGLPPPALAVLHPAVKILKPTDASTVENMSLVVMDALGWTSGESDTFESKIWAVAKPIAHLGYAMGSWLAVEAIVSKAENRDSEKLFFELFFNATLPAYILIAEATRKNLSLIKQFEIKEEETIQFVAA